MAKKDRVKVLASTNPKADPSQVRRVLEIVKKLRERGTKSNGYNLSNPYTRITKDEDEVEDDPRAVILR